METNGGLASKPKENAKLIPTGSNTLYRLYRQRNQAVEIAQLLWTSAENLELAGSSPARVFLQDF